MGPHPNTPGVVKIRAGSAAKHAASWPHPNTPGVVKIRAGERSEVRAPNQSLQPRGDTLDRGLCLACRRSRSQSAQGVWFASPHRRSCRAGASVRRFAPGLRAMPQDVKKISLNVHRNCESPPNRVRLCL